MIHKLNDSASNENEKVSILRFSKLYFKSRAGEGRRPREPNLHTLYQRRMQQMQTQSAQRCEIALATMQPMK